MRLRRRPLLLLALLAPCCALAVQPPRAKVRTGKTIRLATPVASVEVKRAPFSLRMRLGRKLLVQERTGGGLFYERAGTVHGLAAVRDARPIAGGVVLDVATDEGSVATVTLRFLTRRTLEVTLVPPEPAGVAAMGERLRSPSAESIYGLNERLRGPPALRPTL